LKWEAARLGNVLKRAGVRKGDRVIIYLPMIPELAYAMLACARIGAVHSVVFAGFSAHSLRDRILDCEASVVITADEGRRGGKTIPLKAIVDDAVEGIEIVKTVIVAERTGADVKMKPGRDHLAHEKHSQASAGRVRANGCPQKIRSSYCTRLARRANRKASCTRKAATCSTRHSRTRSSSTIIRATCIAVSLMRAG
jgi:acyl-coenzyme A synthetase/AMP-(fatty) acid ligase